MNLQHVQVPDMDLSKESLKAIDPYVYACVKKFMNNKNKKAFPSKETLIEYSGLSRSALDPAIKRLEDAGYLKVNRVANKSNEYIFNDYKTFEIFSYEFLEDSNLTPKEKSYIIVMQQYMFKKPELGLGAVSYSFEELCNILGLAPKTLRNLERSLEAKEVLTKVPTLKHDPTTGLHSDMRLYEFNKYLNTIALTVQKNSIDIESHSKRLDDLEKTQSKLLEYIKKLEKKLEAQEAEIIL